ncbi:hypothetical protein B0H11DRAFT_2254014 [Mycena galericulata]|nr:hypothetical protein B0H11DRAFT_2254014 [Mycena galericulata]
MSDSWVYPSAFPSATIDQTDGAAGGDEHLAAVGQRRKYGPVHIVVAVLIIILTPRATDRGSSAWVAYGIFVVLALVLMLLIEDAVSIIGRRGGLVGFDGSNHTVHSGLPDSWGLLGCCGTRKRRTPPAPPTRARATHPNPAR